MKKRNGVELTVVYPDGRREQYPSIAEAARNIGITRQEINRYLSGAYKTCRAGYKFET